MADSSQKHPVPREVQKKPQGWAQKWKGPALLINGPAPGKPGGQFGKAKSSLPSSSSQLGKIVSSRKARPLFPGHHQGLELGLPWQMLKADLVNE